MSDDPPFTAFAPATRSTPGQVAEAVALLDANEGMTGLLHAIPDLVMLLDRNRQLVFANGALRQALGSGSDRPLLGKRPGEVLSCQHAAEVPSGCGTAPACRYCGAVKAILGSQHGRTMVEECRITSEHQEALDLRVWATPVAIGGATFTCLTARDIADEKRRAFLERIFLHDVMNTAAALQGVLMVQSAGGLPDQVAASRSLDALALRLVEEIAAHRQLVAAEGDELVASRRPLRSLEVLEDLVRAHRHRAGAELRIDPGAEDLILESDPALLGRVVGNMVKNALEATHAAGVVTLSCGPEGDRVAFRVHNPAVLSEEVRLQIFNRSFSTKGEGRGLGTYSMKYLTEKYLGGELTFRSSREEGTTFEARYPRVLRGAAAPGAAATLAAGTDPGRPLPTVVVADDEVVLRRTLSEVLRRAGVKVLAEAANGVEAVEACRAHRPDVLLIDANMPLMSGEAALRIIRAELPSVRSYLLTADSSPEVIGQALAAGARAYLPKGTPLPRMVEWVVEQWRQPCASEAA